MKYFKDYRAWLMGGAGLFFLACVADAFWPSLGQRVMAMLPMSPPRIACDEPVFDFGKVASDETVKHVFSIRNDGKGRLQIGEVRTTCGCAAAELPERVIPPGGSVRLTVRLSSTNFRGPQQQQILIMSNDPSHAYLPLTVKAYVVTELEVTPDRMDFGAVTPKSKEIRTLAIDATRSSSPVKITRVESSHPELVEAKTETIADGKSYHIRLTFKDSLPPGLFRGFVRIHTDHPKESLILVPILAFGDEIKEKSHDGAKKVIATAASQH